jgi:hypothetical protein
MCVENSGREGKGKRKRKSNQHLDVLGPAARIKINEITS